VKAPNIVLLGKGGISTSPYFFEIEGKSAWHWAKVSWGNIILPYGYEACIYSITNTVNGKNYVGHTAKEPYVRWYGHLLELLNQKHLSPHLQNSWNKYGRKAFEFKVLEFCTLANKLEREQFWMDELGAVYNIAKVAGSTLGTKRTPEDRKKFSEAQKRAKTAQRFLHNDKAQQRHKEVLKSKEYRDKMSKSMKGRVRSEQSRRNISEGRKKLFVSGYKQIVTEEQRIKLSLAGKGRKKTPEHQAKINAGLRAAHARKKAMGLKYHETV
jgi:group I intron endonuclease